MKSRDFCYWLQGVFEVLDPKTLDETQVKLIKDHLNMVFIHEIDPSFPAEQQEQLSEAHDGLSHLNKPISDDMRPRC
jgi:hypothetical protein